MTRSLYEVTKIPEGKPLGPGVRAKVLRNIQQALVLASAPARPDTSKPFHLFVDEKAGVAKVVLTQKLGPWHCLIAYLYKKLDSLVPGWPTCLRAIAAVTCLLRTLTS